ncbi:polyamine ABC transporter substrate-binding protein [Meiothermus granaticius]|uniref:Spermidine/putrescine-binding periplasmic protein n=1 Tax=Meiothermus granaticius NBRC 107808 TaxID=1227551 RepID=A0A399F7X6_9DEIN|nr:spermidine/putrescine ABC transporter substrate-binding protein [Meiothermus granaticius]RIH91835.1 Spermidine/putrescine-binding periplasmic protein [Meiothermus granaticius NBRC 107808]GEM85652.1 spermidine/putrescine ABC transporter substrate-binding protein [Meiothermus granaticius NBRC 107808]
MKKWIGIFVLAALLSACGPKGKAELHLLNWSDYMPESVIKDFENREKVKVILDTYDSPEAMLSKLKAGADSEYDLVITSDYLVGQMARDNTIRTLDKSKIPNFKNLEPQFADPGFDPGSAHSVVYQWGTTGLAYREDLVKGPVDSWAVLFDPAKKVGDFLLLDEMREQVGAALKYLGDSVNSTDPTQLAAAERLLIDAKRRSKGFAGGTEIRNRLLAGDIAVGPAYSGDIISAQADNPKLKYVIPKEGATIWADSLMILSKAPNPDLAYKFINYLLEPDVAAEVSNNIGYATPVAAAMPKIKDKDNPLVYPNAQIRSRLEFIHDLGANNDAYNKIWADVKAK